MSRSQLSRVRVTPRARQQDFWRQRQEACSRGGLQHENAHEAGNNGAHECKLEYQGYTWGAVLVKSVLAVVRNG